MDQKAAPAKKSETVFSAPSLSLPKGGGAIRGIGEKFSANPVTGTGNLSIPLAISPGRAGFGPQLSLSYDSGAGNGPFGFGWSLSTPSITRKTDKGLPQYRDAEESDVFLLSGAEDLVPVYKMDRDGKLVRDAQGRPMIEEREDGEYRVRRYRPRIEGLFARIERWTRNGDVHWRSITRDNVLTVYGSDANSRIADPEHPERTFSWLICETRDDKGNAVLYEYKAENGAGVELTQAHQRNRGAPDDPGRKSNRYLKHIRYGNRTPLLDAEGKRPRFLNDLPPEKTRPDAWMFEVVFDYGEHGADAPKPDDPGLWGYRADPFSTYRAGFEVRTCRLCQRVLMFHHFPDEEDVGENCLVRSTDFTYSYEKDPENARNPVYSFLHAVIQAGYRSNGGGSLKRELPPVEFEYTEPIVQDKVEEVDAASLENLPIGVDGAVYQWTDLHGEGIPGILTEQAGAWFYKRNVSPLGERPVEFAPVERVAVKPNLALAGGQAQFMDLAGDGQPDLVVLDGPMPGLYEHDGEEGWEPFRPFTSRLNRNTRDPNLKFIDLDGDGHADVLISEDDAFVWHPSLAEEGFGPARRVPQALDEEKGPRLIFADGTQSIHLADLSGDGLTDLVRIRNGEVCYWPNLGHGRFGAKVTMDNAPWFDHPDQFDPRRLRLADIDGTGTTDLIYLHRDGVRLYFNQSGNGWSDPQLLGVFPRVDDLASIVPTDLLGNGTACLVWSSSLPGDARRPMRYVDLMGGKKPHLLVRTVNNLGAETRVDYASSIRFYLKDKREGRPWITRLPFPVHVVERVETFDHISRNRFVTRYAYHHGYFDGEEREFRGFGMVEQWDTEELAALTVEGALPPATNLDAASHVPPVLTRTWFHTGVYLGREHVSNYFAGLLDEHDQGEYYRAPGLTDTESRALLLPDTVLPPGLTPTEEREACRALKGSMLRQEVYALDGTDKEKHPYTVTEQSFTIRRLQPREDNRHAVFFAHPREALNYHYERDPKDPRVSHSLTLEVDAFGNVLRSLAAGYPRADVPGRLPEQNETHLTLTLDRFVNRGDQPDWYRAGLPVETRTYEVVNPPTAALRFSWEELRDLVLALVPIDQHEPAASLAIPYEDWDWRKQWKPEAEPGGLIDGRPEHTRLRLIEHVRTLYREDRLTALLPLGDVESMALPGESYKLALTPGLLARVFRRRKAGQPDEPLLPDPAPLLEGKGADQGGYAAMDGNWWIPSGRIYFDPAVNIMDPALTAAQELLTAGQHFYQPRKFIDPFGHGTEVEYGYDLLVTRTTDAVDNTVAAVNDYRVLQPREVTDPNRNRTAVAFDALGLLVATAVMGKEGEARGDLLEDFEADPPPGDLQAFLAAPHGQASSLLGNATTRVVYDLKRFELAGQPPFAATLARETHVHDSGDAPSRIQISFSYSDGFGREIQKKIQAEPEKVPGGAVQPRWVGSGWTVYNNKGKPVRQYEPFFSQLPPAERHQFEFGMQAGVSPVLFYDPVERVMATLHPNDTYEKVVFNPWTQITHDVNDTVAARGTQTGDPRTDLDVAGYVRGYFETQPATWQPWYAQRITGQLGAAQLDAARKAADHAATPAIAQLDTLGRTFLTLAHNRFERNGATVEEVYATHTGLDVEGNQRTVTDAKGRLVMRYDYDMLGVRIHQASMEAGERWTLNDAAGKPIRAWDSRGFLREMAYDELRRPTGLFVTEKGTRRLAEQTLYGEGQGDAGNHRTRVYQLFDGAGVVTSEDYDFKGNLRESRRDLLPIYKEEVNWEQNPVPNGGSFTTLTTYDALNRPLSVTSPDGSVYRPTFNEANLLDKVDVNLRGDVVATPFVLNINYNAKGQRELIEYGCGAGQGVAGVTTTYEYDEATFRLINLRTTRSPGKNGFAAQLFADPAVVQDLSYTYDPAGNITRIEDAALRSVSHNGRQIDPAGRYTYDALYRLIEAHGREHIGQTAFAFAPPDGNYRDYPFTGGAHPNDLQALRNYTEKYEYDAVGNFEVFRHIVDGGGWTRRYEYKEESLLEAGRSSNRLTRTSLGNGFSFTESYTYTDDQGIDVHGCMTSIANMKMAWDFEDQLQRVDLGGGGTAYYVYDAAGQRVRKVIEDQNGTPRKARVYLGNYEIYREFNGNGAQVKEHDSLHVMDDKQRIALVETIWSTSSQRYQLGNHLGSACLELDESGELVSYEEYHPYGATAFQAGLSATEVSLKRYRYTGKERDEESGLNCCGARYSAPWIARWISCDPKDMAEGPNVFEFVKDNPVTFFDPNGRDSWRDRLSWGQRFALWVDDVIGPANMQAAADFSAGFGDAVSAGGTALLREHVLDIHTVNYGSTSYVVGEATETVGEALLTGGGAVLRQQARRQLQNQVRRTAVENARQRAVRAARRRDFPGQIPRRAPRDPTTGQARQGHHEPPVYGHPADRGLPAAEARFPSAGLPEGTRILPSPGNPRSIRAHLTRPEHLRRHRYLRRLDAVDEARAWTHPGRAASAEVLRRTMSEEEERPFTEMRSVDQVVESPRHDWLSWQPLTQSTTSAPWRDELLIPGSWIEFRTGVGSFRLGPVVPIEGREPVLR